MIAVRTLTDHGQEALEIAEAVAAFVGEAGRTLDVALYDLRLGPETGPVVREALRQAVLRGVAVRVMTNDDHRGPIPVPPPPRCDVELLQGIGAGHRSVAGVPDLMHHKYAVRDGRTVWTGSTNWTDDSWAREENVVVTIDSEEIAAAYAHNFERLWLTGDVSAGDDRRPHAVDVDGSLARAWFCPAEGPELAHRIGHAIRVAGTRVRVCSPVLSSGPILSSLAEAASSGRAAIAGALDLTQTQEVLDQWEANGVSGWKIETLFHVLATVPFAGKRSTPWAPGSVHDFLHAKLVVADDTAFVGSYNLSHSGERNAENVLEIRDAALADHLAAYVDHVRGLYPAVSLRDPRAAPGARGWVRRRRARRRRKRLDRLGFGG